VPKPSEPPPRTYLALGDSMSIDYYTGVAGGGAASQFFAALGPGWTLDDRTLDNCRIPDVPRDGRGDVITLTIGGNDLLLNREKYLAEGPAEFAAAHLDLLTAIRRANPGAVFIVGDVYAPAMPLSPAETEALAQANDIIHKNCAAVGAQVAGIHDAFRGHEAEYLCLVIEPTLQGATAIARLFIDAYRSAAA